MPQQQPISVIEVVEEKKDDASLVFAELNELGTISAMPEFFSSTRFFLIKALQTKLNVTDVTEHDLIIVMKQQDAYIEIAITCENIFDTCNRNLYSPLTEENIREKIYFEVTSVVKRIYELS